MVVKFFKYPFAVDGTKTTVPNTTQPTGDISYQEGYGVDYQLEVGVDADAKDIERAKFNEIIYQVTLAMQQYQTMGFPDFITSSDNDGSPYEYAINATVRYTNGWAGSGAINYYSLEDANVADPTDASKWGLVSYAVITEPTGTGKDFWGSTLPSGYVWGNGTTIGSAASSSTGRANADTLALFTLLWTSLTNTVLPIQDSTGAASTRGISAAADFSANKRLPTPDKRERLSIGLGTMGGASDPARITLASAGFDPAVLGAFGGVQDVQLTSNQNGAHVHSGSTDSAGVHNHAQTGATNTSSGAIYPQFTRNIGIEIGGVTQDAGAHTHTLSINSSGLGSAHTNVQPTIVCNYIIKL